MIIKEDKELNLKRGGTIQWITHHGNLSTKQWYTRASGSVSE
jgi:hypothetical protein